MNLLSIWLGVVSAFPTFAALFNAIAGNRPRADVCYCLHTLSKRLAKTHTWQVWSNDSVESSLWLRVHVFFSTDGLLHSFFLQVALKALIVIHRAMREVDVSFLHELVNYSAHRGHLLNLTHFKDDSSANGTYLAPIIFLNYHMQQITTKMWETKHMDSSDFDWLWSMGLFYVDSFVCFISGRIPWMLQLGEIRFSERTKGILFALKQTKDAVRSFSWIISESLCPIDTYYFLVCFVNDTIYFENLQL